MPRVACGQKSGGGLGVTRHSLHATCSMSKNTRSSSRNLWIGADEQFARGTQSSEWFATLSVFGAHLQSPVPWVLQRRKVRRSAVNLGKARRHRHRRDLPDETLILGSS